MCLFYYIDKKAGLNHWSAKNDRKENKANAQIDKNTIQNENKIDIKKRDLFKKTWWILIQFPIGKHYFL